MKRSGKYLLGIIFNVTATVFLVLSLLGFIPSLPEDDRNILIIIFAGILMVQALKCASEMDKKKDKK